MHYFQDRFVSPPLKSQYINNNAIHAKHKIIKRYRCTSLWENVSRTQIQNSMYVNQRLDIQSFVAASYAQIQ